LLLTFISKNVIILNMPMHKCITYYWRNGTMKKLLALVLAVVMMLGIASVASAETSLDAVKAAGVLKVGVDAAFAPMTFKDETGAYVGYDIELATAVAAKLGVAVEFVEVDWANLAAALADGTVDCVWSGMSINDERKAAMTISTAYLASDTTLLVHKDVAARFLPMAQTKLNEKNVELRCDHKAREILKNVTPAQDGDFGREFLDYILAVKVVDSTEEAVEHISRHHTKHSDCIVTEDAAEAARFTAAVDSAVVYVNASTRFTDGEEMGFGAEIGISTQKLHARGPMGLDALTTVKYAIVGNGTVRK
jgi:hypothetical protein